MRFPFATLTDRLPRLRDSCSIFMGRISGRRLREAEAESAAKSRQIATVVHELRTPLNGILGMTHLLGQTRLTAEQQNYLSGIRQSGHALAQLVEDLLDFSTLQAGRFRLNNRTASIRQQIETVVEMLAPRAHEKGLELAATVAADVPELLEFDPARLRQVLFNVIGNAVKFTERGGVLISVRAEGSDIVIAVADTGPGMDADARIRLFREFEQMGNAAQRSGGTGLGLAIALHILRELGGSLSAASELGLGTTFTIRFPLRLAEDAPAGATRRGSLLERNRVLLLAPAGPAATATVATIETLGGTCRHVESTADAAELLTGDSALTPFTDLIVDHRLAAQSVGGQGTGPLHCILLVNPEERASQPQELYDAWLIRPLREKSLIDVLSGRLKGSRSREEASLPAGSTTEAVSPPAVSRLHVLVAEDDPVGAKLVSAALRKRGHRVDVVDNARSILDHAVIPDGRPDVIITDLHMPGMPTMEALSELRRHEGLNRLSATPVIVLSGDASGQSLVGSEALDISARLGKPTDPQHLLQLVEQLASRKVAPTELH
nr:response regulator [Rhizobium sp. Khangiran2]